MSIHWVPGKCQGCRRWTWLDPAIFLCRACSKNWWGRFK